MENSQERRNFPRANTCLQITIVEGSDAGLLSGEIRNLTVEGIAFTLDRPLTPGSKVGVEITSSGEEIRNNALQAEVLRCEPGGEETAPRYQISAKLIDANDQFLMDALALVHGRQA